MKKRAVELIAFAFLSALLIALCISVSTAKNTVNESEEEIIHKSEEAVSHYNGLYIDNDGTIISLYPYHGKEGFGTIYYNPI